jgi:hypothetical protein
MPRQASAVLALVMLVLAALANMPSAVGLGATLTTIYTVQQSEGGGPRSWRLLRPAHSTALRTAYLGEAAVVPAAPYSS